MAMLLISCPTIAAAKISVLAREDADEAKTHLILYNERVCPLNSLALDFTRQLTGGSTYRGLSAEQLLLSIPYAPELWSEQELLHIGNTTLKKRLGITTDRARIKDFFTPSGEYRLKQLLDEENSKPTSAQDASLIEAIHTADKQIALFESDVKGTLIQPYRGTGVSMIRIKAEILYNTIRALIPPAYLPKIKDTVFPFGVSIILVILGYITLANLWKDENSII